MPSPQPSLREACAAELVGTFLLVFFGCGAVHVAVVLGALHGGWQVASVWGFAVALAVYAVGNISGAHINPAITLALTCWSGFPRGRVLPYVASQLAGAFVAAVVLFVIFGATIAAYEEKHGIDRGKPGSEVTAAMYGEYFPNPTIELHGAGTSARLENLTTPVAAFAEVLGTAVLAFLVFAYSDPRNRGGPGERLAPFFVGMTVALVVTLLGPMTQSCLNPARDFGPRIFASLAGWGTYAFTGPRDVWATLLVYLLSPVVGAVLGGFVYAKLVGPAQGAAA
jgi:glycerol uptake facilitator protein